MLAWAGGGLLFLLLGLWTGFLLWSPQVMTQFQRALASAGENTLILDRNGQPVAGVSGLENRSTIPIEQMSSSLVRAVVATEDQRFFDHKGMDPWRLAGAAWADLTSMEAAQGGSTITQQLVKLTLLSPEKTLRRKVKEVFMAMALERQLEKKSILEHYLNQIYLGNGTYGVEKAAQGYFHKPAQQLTLGESAFLAALIRMPEGYFAGVVLEGNPSRYLFPPDHPLMVRRQRVLERLLQLKWITQAAFQEANATPLAPYKPVSELSRAPYFVSHVLKEMHDILQGGHISGKGFRIYTTLDARQQVWAEEALSQAARLKDKPQAALVAMDPVTGHVRALVGGVDFSVSQFNRATQATRQPGSAVKPLLYAAALEHGFQPNSVFSDEPVVYQWGQTPNNPGETYEPHNYNGLYGVVREAPGRPLPVLPLSKDMTLGQALAVSSNVVAIQVLDRIGMNSFSAMGRKMGVEIDSRKGLCVALGCSETTPLALTASYAPFANGGLRQRPVFILKVTSMDGELLYEYQPPPPLPVISPWTAFQMNRLLAGVVERGTATRANLGRPQGGKTGTNDGPRDTWFIGFTPELLTGVWMGQDDNRVMKGEVGGTTTASMWKAFMEKALAAEPTRGFPVPPDEYDMVSTCLISGDRAGPHCPAKADFPYRTGDDPEAECRLHQGPLVSRMVDMETGELATPFCPTHAVQSRLFYASAELTYCHLHAPPGWSPPEQGNALAAPQVLPPP